MSLFHRLGHLKDAPIPKLNAWVLRGDLIGYVGTTGASSGPHLHYDIFDASVSIIKALGGFTSYVYGKSIYWVGNIFKDPASFIRNGIPCDWSLPQSGYHFLQYVRDPSKGVYYHPGEDVNGVDDYGKPVYAPVDGRVVYRQAPSDRIWNKLFGWLAFGKGWGNMLVIEQSPYFKMPTDSKFSATQLSQLNAAALRRAQSKASDLDIRNLEYAESKGYVYKP